ncbi:MAG TPA: hypothetical protein ENN33_06630 [Ignavibacteria bacterium]|nr:hypothetical protein [Ignavibacteria bacterium]
MYRKVEDFINTWKTEEEATVKIFSNIGDEHLSKTISDNTRSLGRLAWHITQTLTEMGSKVGLVDTDYLDGKPIPGTVSEIIDQYKKYSNELAASVKPKWTDDDLTQKMDLYGESWERGRILEMLVNHQIHHRAQMTIIMRLLGLQVPGIYGPSKEEWKNYGMEPQD